MLSLQDLASISRELRDEHVLTVYLDSGFDDPALRTAWREKIDRSIKNVRRHLVAASHAEKASFEHCVELLNQRLSELAGGVGAPGWVALITVQGVRVAEKIRAPMPTLALWTIGACVAPYVRALKQERPVVVIVADASTARLYRYVRGVVEPAHILRARAVMEEPVHMGDAPRPGFHTGTRGTTGRDASRLAHRVATDRLIEEVTRRSLEMAGHDGWIIVAGIPEVGTHIARTLDGLASGRVLHLHGVDVHSTDAGVRAAAERGASQLRDEMDVRRVAEITGAADDPRLVTCGPAATRRALDRASVRELYLTPRFVEGHLADAEYSVRAAIAQSATIEEVSRVAAQRLDEFGGVGARLRFAART
jgi:hypothetical protein